MTDLDAILKDFLCAEGLPPAYRTTAERWFVPLAEQLSARRRVAGAPLLVGINGCQGSGKSTLAALLVGLLNRRHGWHSVALSIDDFYLTLAERRGLAQTVHPLLGTRGVPGTHDVALMRTTVAALMAGGDPVAAPRFDKAADDRAPRRDWPVLDVPLDVVILEGWCVGIPAQTAAALDDPVNALEAEEDADGRWRRYVNHQLADAYAGFFAGIDLLLMLRAPSFARVFDWRLEQERKLVARTGGGPHTLSPEALGRFVQHYQRLTEHALAVLPGVADTVFQLDEERSITAVTVAGAVPPP